MRISPVNGLKNNQYQSNAINNNSTKSINYKNDIFSPSFKGFDFWFVKDGKKVGAEIIDKMSYQEIRDFAKTLTCHLDKIKELCGCPAGFFESLFNYTSKSHPPVAIRRFNILISAINEARGHITYLENKLLELKKYPLSNSKQIAEIEKELTHLKEIGVKGIAYRSIKIDQNNLPTYQFFAGP